MSLDSAIPLATANHPSRLWQLVGKPIAPDAWERAARSALGELEGLPAITNVRDIESLIEAILVEGQFGPEHWDLSKSRRFYYNTVRALLPDAARPLLRKFFLRPQLNTSLLKWPIEERYVKFQRAMVETLRQELEGREPLRHVGFWPQGREHALVLTHDIEGEAGLKFVREVASLEEQYGFRSCFNFVPEDYAIDPTLFDELRERGFEVGVHGLNHSGNLFLSRKNFESHAPGINGYLKKWNAVGFRAPFTHRHPVWMQDLEMEYDCSFFDTDPFETIPGGTMSIWPFMLGRFVELPYTLVQDHTLVKTLGETTPRIWLDKVDFIARHGGMAQLITHPDYLLDSTVFSVYEEFLRAMSKRSGTYWPALPREVAAWWRRRHNAGTMDPSTLSEHLPEAVIVDVSKKTTNSVGVINN